MGPGCFPCTRSSLQSPVFSPSSFHCLRPSGLPLQWLRLAHVVYAKPPSPGAGTTTVLFAVDASSVAVPNPLALSATAAAAGATEEEARAKAALKPAEEALEKAEEVGVWDRKCECLVCGAPVYARLPPYCCMYRMYCLLIYRPPCAGHGRCSAPVGSRGRGRRPDRGALGADGGAAAGG